MVFRLNINTFDTNIHSVKLWVKKKFITNLLSFKVGPNEVALNKYCIQHYKKPLKILCMLLFDKSKFSKDTDNNILILFDDRRLDDIAKLITYGTGKLQGSKIFAWSLGRVN